MAQRISLEPLRLQDAGMETVHPQRTEVAAPTLRIHQPGKSTGIWSASLAWPAVLWLGVVHLGALAAPFFFTWKAVLLALLLSWMTAGLGVCLGFHRLLTHKSFETFPPIRKCLAWLGTLAGEGPPIMWVAAHRKHHQFSDQDGDPHSPRDGVWWSHVFWMFAKQGSGYWAEQYRRYAPDLLRDRFIRFLNKTWLAWQPLTGIALFAAGTLAWEAYTGISFMVYGLFVQMVYVFHITWLVNSASHMWGYRNYETTDNSRNLWWVALLTYGEGWHNNHHAFQRMARHGIAGGNSI